MEERPDDSQKSEKNFQSLIFFSIMGNIVKQFKFSLREKMFPKVYIA